MTIPKQQKLNDRLTYWRETDKGVVVAAQALREAESKKLDATRKLREAADEFVRCVQP